jgi:hypothetical protein
MKKYLATAKVPENLHSAALSCLLDAKKRTKGLLLHKIKARWFMAGKIAKSLPWEAERLIDVKPEWAEYDIEPMLNITAQGDNTPWQMTIQGGRPHEGHWLNPDKNSVDYMKAVASCYWSKGNHPRSQEARKDWYQRNGGAYKAYRLGERIDLSTGVKVWSGRDGKTTVSVYQCGVAWQIIATKKIVGKLCITTRVGYEITNVWNESTGEQAWYPIAGHDLKAPVTWSVLPKWSD